MKRLNRRKRWTVQDEPSHYFLRIANRAPAVELSLAGFSCARGAFLSQQRGLTHGRRQRRGIDARTHVCIAATTVSNTGRSREGRRRFDDMRDALVPKWCAAGAEDRGSMADRPTRSGASAGRREVTAEGEWTSALKATDRSAPTALLLRLMIPVELTSLELSTLIEVLEARAVIAAQSPGMIDFADFLYRRVAELRAAFR
jgi:hypothetical protein